MTKDLAAAFARAQSGLCLNICNSRLKLFSVYDAKTTCEHFIIEAYSPDTARAMAVQMIPVIHPDHIAVRQIKDLSQ